MNGNFFRTLIRIDLCHTVSSDIVLVSFQIHSTDTTSEVVIFESKLNHSGRYIINAESPAGHKVVKVRVNVLGM